MNADRVKHVQMKDIVAGLLQRDAKVRLTVLDAVAALSELLQRRPLEEDTITDVRLLALVGHCLCRAGSHHA
jgi:hypothetical protein